MSSLWKHENGRYYVLYGPRSKKSVSTGTKDRREAEVFYAQFIAGSENPVSECPTVGELLDQYHTERGPEVRSQLTIKICVNRLKAHVGDLLPHQLLPPVITQYVKDRDVASGTILRELGVLRTALKWASKHNRISLIPHIGNPVEPYKPRERWLSREEGRALLQACHQPHVRLFVMLGLMTAARMSAILELTWDKVNLEVCQIDYGEGFGNKRRSIVAINEELVFHLEAAKAFACDPVSGPVIEFRGEAVTNIYHGFKLACRRAKLSDDVSPHVLRHTAASWMAQDAVPWREIAQMLGDSEETVQRVYAKFHPEYGRNASNSLGAALGGPKRARLGFQGKSKFHDALETV